MIIRCAVCHSDPAGRWKPPSAILYKGSDGEFRYREHISDDRHLLIIEMEMRRGYPNEDCPLHRFLKE
jgi:hypothetical protein